MSDEIALRVDTLGRRCPVPVIELAKHIGEVGVGEVVEILSDDPASAVDIPVWCRMKGHDYVGQAASGDAAAHRVRRGT